MTDADRIAAIRARLQDGRHVADEDIAFLLAEVDRLTAELSERMTIAAASAFEQDALMPNEPTR